MTFRETWRRRICEMVWRFKNGHSKPEKFTVTGAGLQSRHLAIILPPEFHEFDIARTIYPTIIERVKPEQTTVIVRENFRTWLTKEEGTELLCFDPTQKSWPGFPKSDLLRKVKGLDADVVVDLTPGFDPFVAALAAFTQGPLRISFDIEEQHGFYNYFIRLDHSRPLAERYDALLQYV
jgi:hypothetical protein